MASFQSSLEESDIADELAAGQRAISIAEFFEKNKHMLGFDSDARALVTAVKEAVDNALDATEEAGFLPDVYVEITETGDYYTLIVEDNGPGITKDQIPKIFGKLLYGSRFHKREQSLTPDQRVMVRRDGDIEFLPVGVLCDAYLPPEGADTAPIQDEIEVPSFNRTTHEMTWQPVTHAIRHETDERTYEITTEKGRSVEVTGNHSLFSLTKDGETREVRAAKLKPGDSILVPRSMPSFDETVSEVNLLERISLDQLDGRRIYVYGFDKSVLEEIRTGETVRQKPTEASQRQRYYYRYQGVDILKESLEKNYLEKGYLPAETVIKLGWEQKAADCELRTYQVGGKQTSMPVTVPLSSSFMQLIGYYISEGHVGDRQAGFTFGSHETELIGATERAIANVGGSTSTVTRARNSTRVKAFGSPINMFLENVCGDRAENKRIPGFIFHAKPQRQREFIAALYQGDGSDAHPSNELSHSTVSETLARQLSTLWNMQGVLASTEVKESNGYAEGTTLFRTKVYGEDVNLPGVFSEKTNPGEQRYKRIPTSILNEVRVGGVEHHSVPDSIPGLLMGAGVGSNLQHAKEYQSVIERAIAGEKVTSPRYAHNLKEKGLLDGDNRATTELEALWETITNLQGFTESDLCLLPVKHVEETEPSEYVYDISVPGDSGFDENFVVCNEGALTVKNSRGQQGIGISAAVLYAQLTSGTPTKITSRTPKSSEANYYELIIDTESNEPEIQREDTTTWDRPHGTRIELKLEANMRARQQLHDYITYTAIVNPHARLELIEPDAEFKFDRATDELPAETTSIRPHPHGVELGTLIKMLGGTDSYSLSGFLQGEFTRVGGKTSTDILNAFRDRYFGRELAWGPPRGVDDVDLARALQNAVVNKGADATAAFAERVADGVADAGAVAHHELVALVNETADGVEEEFGANFGSTVRENAVDAGWDALTADRVTPLYDQIREATSQRKGDETVRAFVERLAPKFDGADRDRFTHSQLVEFVDRAAEKTAEYAEVSFGETARENVVEALWGSMRRVPDELPSVTQVAKDRDAAADLLAGMRAVEVMSPPTNCLSPISAELIEEGLKKEVDCDFYKAVTRDAEVHGGDPFIVEAGIAYGGELKEESQAELLRFANRVPLVYQQGACAITDVIRGIDWRNYGLDQSGGSGMPGGPAMILVHVASTNVPFTSESKDAVANVPSIEKQVELAVREAARGMKSHLNKRRSLQQRRQKQSVIADILPKMAAKVASVTGRETPPVDESLARIMNNVLVAREANGDSVELVVENHTDAGVDLELSEVLDAEPENASDGRVVDLDDGEWVVKWDLTVGAGETASLTYDVDDGVESDLTVDGPETEKLTVQT